MTQREFYEAIIQTNLSEELTTFASDALRKMDEALRKMDERNAKRSSTLSLRQKENREVMDRIVQYLSGSEDGAFASEIAKSIEASVQKASALAIKLTKEGRILCKEEKVKGRGKLKKYYVE